jgi:Tol biopolymer transport system component
MDLSADVTRVSFARRDPMTGAQNIWVANLSRGGFSRMTFGSGIDSDPKWSPDGTKIAFSSRGNQGRKSLYVMPSSGGSESLLLESSGPPLSIDAWSPDSQFVLYHLDGTAELMALPLTGDRKPFVVVKSGVGIVDEPAFSPDGRWIAYNASGRHEVYVIPFPPREARFQVSTSGGVQPRWRGDGRELFFFAPDGTMMATDIRAGTAFEAGVPRAMFRTRGAAAPLTDQYVVTPNGQRFLIMQPLGDRLLPPFAAIVNWPSLISQ